MFITKSRMWSGGSGVGGQGEVSLSDKIKTTQALVSFRLRVSQRDRKPELRRCGWGGSHVAGQWCQTAGFKASGDDCSWTEGHRTEVWQPPGRQGFTLGDSEPSPSGS